ncbi:MAG: hypothetical protein QOE68_1695 [Thermoanaerobaculia bacterium]|nr:hypothetical protein [Thermoanaerobaculia bacterium]
MKTGTMVRKQVYLEQRHDQMLKRRASQRGVSEAELIREALDHVDDIRPVRRREVDLDAARQALAFMRSLSARGSRAPKGRTWTRESLYEDRIGRWTKS